MRAELHIDGLAIGLVGPFSQNSEVLMGGFVGSFSQNWEALVVVQCSSKGNLKLFVGSFLQNWESCRVHQVGI